MPGTPIIPVPSMLISAIPLIVVIPFTARIFFCLEEMHVPADSGLNVFLM